MQVLGRPHLTNRSPTTRPCRHDILHSSRIRTAITPRLHRRIGSFEALDRADITIYQDSADITLSRSEGLAGFRTLKVGILGHHRQDFPLSRLCNLSMPPLSDLEHLYVHGPCPPHYWDIPTESTQWLEVFPPSPSTCVKNLHLSEDKARRVERALVDLSATGVSPSLQDFFSPGYDSYNTRMPKFSAMQYIFNILFGDCFMSAHYRKGGNFSVKLVLEVDGQ